MQPKTHTQRERERERKRAIIAPTHTGSQLLYGVHMIQNKTKSVYQKICKNGLKQYQRQLVKHNMFI
jgi:hypothetical protein